MLLFLVICSVEEADSKDRVYASIMGSLAVDLLLEGKTNRVVGYKHGEYIDFDINEALAMQKGIPSTSTISQNSLPSNNRQIG